MELGTLWIYVAFSSTLTIGVIEVFWTLYRALKTRRKSDVVIAGTVGFVNLVSCIMIVAMFMGAWPTTIPLICIGGTTMIVLAQYLLNK